MLDTTILFTLIIALMIAAFLAWLFYLQRKNKREELKNKSNSSSLPLQAYERLTLLVDRIAIPNLVSRTNTGGLTAQEMQLILIKTIRDEFDYNVTQQIYVSREAWNAVKQLKEKKPAAHQPGGQCASCQRNGTGTEPVIVAIPDARP